MNYYEILKVSKNANEKEIKNSYKALVKKYHPDVYVADKDFAEKKIKEINEAYEILSNPETRLEYDKYLEEMSQSTIVHYSSKNASEDTQNSEPIKSSEMQGAFSQFIFNKFDKLSKRRQIQIFIIGLMIILMAFLINIINLKNSLTSQNNSNSTENTNIVDDDYYNNIVPDFDANQYRPNYYYNYSEEDMEQINELYRNLMEQYMNDYNESIRQFGNWTN